MGCGKAFDAAGQPGQGFCSQDFWIAHIDKECELRAKGDKDVSPGRVCGLFGCYKIHDAAEPPFTHFCSSACEIYYKELERGRTPDCANPGCEDFAVPPFLPFCCLACSKECSLEEGKLYEEALQGRTPDECTMHAGSVSARLTEEQQTSQQSYYSPPATDPWAPQPQTSQQSFYPPLATDPRSHTIRETSAAEDAKEAWDNDLHRQSPDGRPFLYKAPPPRLPGR